MNYRTLGFGAMLSSALFLAKTAFYTNDFFNRPVLTSIFEIAFTLSFLCLLAGNWKLFIKPSDKLEQFTLTLPCIFLLTQVSGLMIKLIHPFTSVNLFLVIITPLNLSFILLLGFVYLYTGSASGWKKYSSYILPSWILMGLISFFLMNKTGFFQLYYSAIVAITCSILGYQIYTSKDPGIINDNILYELSSI